MEYQMKKENLLIRLKNILNEDNVKLWLPPYYEEGKCNSDSLQELKLKYHRVLNIDEETCLELLKDLQTTSLCRLEERHNFRTQGLATLLVRVSSKQIPEFSVQIRLCDIANDLRVQIAEKVEVSFKRLKLICGGRVLVPEQVLGIQNVKHGCTILVVVLPSEEEQHNLVESNNNQTLLNETKSDVECLLAGSSDSYLNVTNQSGASLNLPPDEKKALALAMALHEKGRASFRTEEFSLALVFFLEADSEFKYCRSDLLKQVDNYALLNLDIVWTYLHLQSLHCLNDAEERLRVCENGFIRTYGLNMERLRNIKGTHGNENVLFVRLRLLQGILCYLTNRQTEAEEKFNEVETKIQVLKVDNENVKILCDMGYSAEEGRIALRATYHDLPAAIEYITKQREEKKRIKEHERIKRFADRHKCLNGDLVNLTVLQQLHSMGYTRLFGVYALINSNNHINDALIWIDNLFNALYTQYPSAAINKMKELEFDDSNVRNVLKRHSFELNDMCVHELLSLVDEELLLPNLPNIHIPSDWNTEQLSSQPSTSSGTPARDASESGSSANQDENTPKKLKRRHEALSRLQECISHDADDYLGIDLESEEIFLYRYKSLLPH